MYLPADVLNELAPEWHIREFEQMAQKLAGHTKTCVISFIDIYKKVERKTLIRANQGHSIPVDVELPVKKPPVILYHGTGEKYVTSIDEQGLIPKSRLYVHLSGDESTTKVVGSRHGKPVIYEIHASQMYNDGYIFYQSVNGVWLTKSVPVKYMKKM